MDRVERWCVPYCEIRRRKFWRNSVYEEGKGSRISGSTAVSIIFRKPVARLFAAMWSGELWQQERSINITLDTTLDFISIWPWPQISRVQERPSLYPSSPPTTSSPYSWWKASSCLIAMPLTLGVDFNSTLGPLLVGFGFSCVIFGILSMQAFTYFQRFPNDLHAYKALVRPVVLYIWSSWLTSYAR